MPKYEEIKNDVLFKKLEKMITRNFFLNGRLNHEASYIHCEAVRIEADLMESIIGCDRYKFLFELPDNALRTYLSASKRTSVQ